MKLTPEQLKSKYGDASVMGVDAGIITEILKEGFTDRKDASACGAGVCCSLRQVIQLSLYPKPRHEAELDPSFKQIIPYVIQEHTGSDRVYGTLRIGGDERLKGQMSIGLGGHMDEGESVTDALYRELKEEVGLERSDVADLAFCGYLYSEQTDVDSVRVGMVYRLLTDRDDIACMESDKLQGRWYALDELRAQRESGAMESWSELVYDVLLGGKRG